jgi:glycerol-3-phosphate cytidylyltransferase
MDGHMKTLYTGGTFDLFHSGHANFLKQCRILADKVVVALNTDEFVQRYKKSLPVYSYQERKEILLACRYADHIIENTDGEDSKPTILKVAPQILAIGDDWAKKDYYKQMNFTQQWLDENSIILVYLPYTQGISTTALKARIVGQ